MSKPIFSGFDDAERSTNLATTNDAFTATATDMEDADRAPTDGQRQAFPEYKGNTDKAFAQ